MFCDQLSFGQNSLYAHYGSIMYQANCLCLMLLYHPHQGCICYYKLCVPLAVCVHFTQF